MKICDTAGIKTGYGRKWTWCGQSGSGRGRGQGKKELVYKNRCRIGYPLPPGTKIEEIG